jgi:hypothetical protein
MPRNTTLDDHHTLLITVHPPSSLIEDRQAIAVRVEVSSDDGDYCQTYLDYEGVGWRGDEIYRHTITDIYHPYYGWVNDLTIIVLYNGDKLISCEANYPIRYLRAMSAS